MKNKIKLPKGSELERLDEFIERCNISTINAEGDFIISKCNLKKMLTMYAKTIGNE